MYGIVAVFGAIAIGTAQMTLSIMATQSSYELSSLVGEQRDLTYQKQILYDDVAGLRAQLRENLCPLRTRIYPRALDVGDWTREQNPAWTRVDANENDERLTRPKMAREVGRPRDDVSGRVRYSGRRDDAALQVDDDERRRARIECEFAHAQSSWRKNEFARDVGDRRAPTQRHRQIHLAANMLQHRSHAGLAAECQPP